MRFRHPTGEAARRYNVPQNLADLVVVSVLVPLTVLSGLAMSPWANSVLPGWVDLFGGRQSARTIHFVVARLLSRESVLAGRLLDAAPPGDASRDDRDRESAASDVLRHRA